MQWTLVYKADICSTRHAMLKTAINSVSIVLAR